MVKRASMLGRGASASANGSDSETLLEFRDLRVTFATRRGLVRAVDGVNLRVERGRTLGLVGESGSGKTVLSRSVMDLVPRARG